MHSRIINSLLTCLLAGLCACSPKASPRSVSGWRTDGGSGASSMQITLVVNDQTEGGVNASVQNGELDGRQIAIIVKQVENAMVARSLNGKSMYTKYLDKTRGLSNAKQLY